MLKKFDTREIISKREAKKRYSTQHMIMVITEIFNNGQDYNGYVVYAADDERELISVPISEFGDTQVGFLAGDRAEPYPQIGNVIYYD